MTVWSQIPDSNSAFLYGFILYVKMFLRPWYKVVNCGKYFLCLCTMNDVPWSCRPLLQMVNNTCHAQPLYICCFPLFCSHYCLCKLSVPLSLSLTPLGFLSFCLSLTHSTCRKTDIPQLPVFRYFIIMTDNHLEEHFFSFQNKSLNNTLSLQTSCAITFMCAFVCAVLATGSDIYTNICVCVCV